MDEHSQCSAQAVQYYDSEHGPIKVMYFSSRKDLENVGQKFLTSEAEEEQSTINAPYYTLPEKTPRYTLLSISVVRRPATDGNATYPVSFGAPEVPESGNLEKFLGGHAFDDEEKYQSIGKGKNGDKKEGQKEEKKDGQKEDKKKGQKEGKKKGQKEGKKKEQKEDEKKKQKEDEKKKQEKKTFVQRLKDFLKFPKPQQMIPSNDHEPTPSPSNDDYIRDKYGPLYPRYYGYKYALVFDVATKFNPSGIWVIEEFYNDEDELEY